MEPLSSQTRIHWVVAPLPKSFVTQFRTRKLRLNALLKKLMRRKNMLCMKKFYVRLLAARGLYNTTESKNCRFRINLGILIFIFLELKRDF